MNVLIVSSFNKSRISPFVMDQMDGLKKITDMNVFYYGIVGKGLIGYLKNLCKLKQTLESKKIDLIHAHYGLSGMLCCLQWRVPVITTFHGSDVNNIKNLPISLLVSKMTQFSIITNRKLLNKIKPSRYAILPCGIKKEFFYPIGKEEAKRKLGIEKKYILFGSSFDRKVKNSSLAKSAIDYLDKEIELIELKYYSKEEVNLLLNGAELLLVTSHSETGPLIVKEAIATNTPIVSTDVGDVKELIKEFDQCYISSSEPKEIAKYIEEILNSQVEYNGKKLVESFLNENIVKELAHIYTKVIDNSFKKNFKT